MKRPLKHEPVSFVDYVKSLPPTETAHGAFIGQLKSDSEFSDINSSADLRSYLSHQTMLMDWNTRLAIFRAGNQLWIAYELAHRPPTEKPPSGT